MSLQVRDDRIPVEGFGPQAQVIHVAALPRIGFHQVDLFFQKKTATFYSLSASFMPAPVDA